MRRTTVSPSAASSTRECRAESLTSRFPPSSGSALPGKRRTVSGSAGGTYGPSPRCSVPFASWVEISSSISRASPSACPSPAMVATTYPSGSTTASVGHALAAYCCHMSISASSSTGWCTPYRSTAAASAAGSFSCSNFGECTPITTRTSPYFSSSGRSSSSTCRQLMQQNVQKSSRTILPRRSASVTALPPVFSQARPRSSGARTRALMPPSCRTGRACSRRSRGEQTHTGTTRSAHPGEGWTLRVRAVTGRRASGRAPGWSRRSRPRPRAAPDRRTCPCCPPSTPR